MLQAFLTICSGLWPFFGLGMVDAHKKKYGRAFILCLIGFCLSLSCGGVLLGLEITSDTKSIGAFAEEMDYERNYSAFVYADGDEEHSVFAIAEVTRFEGDYWLHNLRLPYGRVLNLDCEFERGKDISFCLNWDYTVHLNQPATKADNQLLENMVVNDHGFFLGNLDSSVYHTESCSLAHRIKTNNLVYFKSAEEAELFLFTPCSVCDPRRYA